MPTLEMGPVQFAKCRKYSISKLNFEIFFLEAPDPLMEGGGARPAPFICHSALSGNKADL